MLNQLELKARQIQVVQGLGIAQVDTQKLYELVGRQDVVGRGLGLRFRLHLDDLRLLGLQLSLLQSLAEHGAFADDLVGVNILVDKFFQLLGIVGVQFVLIDEEVVAQIEVPDPVRRDSQLADDFAKVHGFEVAPRQVHGVDVLALVDQLADGGDCQVVLKVHLAELEDLEQRRIAVLQPHLVRCIELDLLSEGGYGHALEELFDVILVG